MRKGLKIMSLVALIIDLKLYDLNAWEIGVLRRWAWVATFFITQFLMRSKVVMAMYNVV